MTAKQLMAETSVTLDQGLAYALLENDRFPEAIAQAQLAIAEWPPEDERGAEGPWLVLIAAESENGQTAEARADLQKFLATPRAYRSIAEVEKGSSILLAGWPATAGNNLILAGNSKLLEGLRHAGMPEE
jgi:hypothetical protein